MAVSKAWELESKPGRSSVNKTLSMIDSHRSQIAASDRGSVGSVQDRHKKVKQSIGDSMKLAMLPSQPPPDFDKQQKRFGRPHKMMDQSAVAGVMQGEQAMTGQGGQQQQGSTPGGPG